jgi:hypothetical protein
MTQSQHQLDLTPAKKPYRKPRLTIFGDMRTNTLSNAVSGAADSGNQGQVHKTV